VYGQLDSDVNHFFAPLAASSSFSRGFVIYP